MRDKVFYAICAGFVGGVFLRSLFLVNIYVAVLLCVISLGIFLFHKFVSKNKWGILAGVFVFAFAFGIFRFNIADKPKELPFDLWSQNYVQIGQSASLSGEIIDEPEQKENNQRLVVLLDSDKKSKILLTTGFDEEYKYGDVINFYGKLEKPENFTTDQGKEFDYINYLKKDGIFYVMKYPKIELVSRGRGSKIKSALFSVKEKFLRVINSQIPEPDSLLMGGLILGEKAPFSQDFTQKFINTGTIHIVALSGYNVTIVAEWIMKLFIFLPMRLGIGIGIFAILLFILMTGASSTAIRAGIMATLALVARATGRNYDVARALLLAGIVMVLFNPFVLVFDVSFELSFLAAFAVIFLAPRIEKYFMWITPKFQLRDIVSVTCAAYIFVLPFILYKMGNLSLVALPSNVFILPFIPITMLFGFLTGIFGSIWYIFAVPFALISQALLSYELFIINFFSSLPFSSFTLRNFPLIMTLAIYAYFIYRIFGRSIKKFFEEI